MGDTGTMGDMNQFKCYYHGTTAIKGSKFQRLEGVDHVNKNDQITVVHFKFVLLLLVTNIFSLQNSKRIKWMTRLMRKYAR